MTNPNNAIGTNAAFNGRTSPNALNDVLASFTKGIVSGWACSPKSGMTVQLGGEAGTRDVALAEDNAGNKLTINNRSGAPVEVTLGGAPSTNNRIDAIVAYIDNPSTGDDNTTDNPTTCGIIAVQGTVAANPTAPSEATIRSAITTDGATGGTAYYVVLATVLVGTNITTIGSGVITQGAQVITLGTALQALNGLNDFMQKFNLTNITQGNESGYTVTGHVINEITLAQNSDGSIFKFYGKLQINPNSSASRSAIPGLSGYYGVDVGVELLTHPTTAYIVKCSGMYSENNETNCRSSQNIDFAVGTNGHIYVQPDTSSSALGVTSGHAGRSMYLPAIYFNGSFGDTPSGND